MALNLSLLPADVQKAIAANPDLFTRSTTAARDRANSITFNASSEGGQTQGYGVNALGGNGGKQGAVFANLGDTWNGQMLLDAMLNKGSASHGYAPIDSTVDFTDKKRWLPGAEQAVLGSARFDPNMGLMVDQKMIDKFGLSPELSFMDKLVPALILSAVGMGAGQMFQAANAGGFLPAAQSGFESGAMFSGGAGGGAGGAVAGGGAGGYTAGQQAALDNLISQLEVADAAGTIGSGGGAAAGVNAANQQALDEFINNLIRKDEAAQGAAGSQGGANPPATGGGAGGTGSVTDTIKNIYNTVKPYKDALSLVQTGASVIQGVNNRNAMSDAADKQAATAAEQLRQQQAAQQAQEEAARQALELQRQAQEKLLAQQNAQLQEQLRLQQSMASYQQQVYSQQLAQAAKDARLAEEQLRRNSQRNPDFAAAVTGNRRAGAMGVGGTMLTGADGVDPQSLLLGRATLLGG